MTKSPQQRSRLAWLVSHRTWVIRICFALLPVIGIVDYWSNSDLGLSVLYAVPVAGVAWVAGAGLAALASFAGAALWLGVEVLGGPSYPHPAAPYWNAAVQLGFFLVIGLALSRLHAALAERNRLVRDLRRALAERDKAVEQLARSNADLEEYAYVAAHDLRAPLVNIGGFAQLLQKTHGERLDLKAQQMVATIVAQTARMDALIGALLEYAKLGAGEPVKKLVDTGETLDRALETVQAESEAQGATVIRDTLPSVPADRVQLERLFQNLLANAIKYRGEAPPRIQVSAVPRGEDWEFAVADNGVGIAPQDGEKLFRLFSRLPGSSAVAGTGIGLAACKKIVERHGGRIWVDSELGRGTTVRFTLPASTDAASQGSNLEP
jgi:signal transduction histidine kinase